MGNIGHAGINLGTQSTNTNKKNNQFREK